MLISKVVDGIPQEPVEHNLYFGESLPVGGHGNSDSYYQCNLFRPHDKLTQRLVKCDPTFENGWVYLVSIQSLTDSEIAANKVNALSALKTERNCRLNECEWSQLPDERAIVGSTKATEWDVYRENVRNVPFLSVDPRLPLPWPISPDTIK
jgi:hypothetical protein